MVQRKILVTGATGFIGWHCLKALRGHDVELHGVARADPDDDIPGVVWHRADLMDKQAVHSLVAGLRPTSLLHLGWYVTPGKYWTASENLDWLAASIELLQSFAKCGGCRFVGVGTCAEYKWESDRLIESVTPVAPSSLYGICKVAFSSVLDAYARQMGLSTAWARLFYTFGPREQLERLVPSVAVALLQGRPADCTSGEQIRDFLYVEDVASALAHITLSEMTGPVNVSSGTGIAIRRLVEILAARLGRPDLVRFGARFTPPGEPPVLVGDCAKLAATGWRPRYSPESGIDLAAAYWKKRLATRTTTGAGAQ